MALTYQLIVLLGLSSGLWMGANAGCTSDCCITCPEGWTVMNHRCYQFVKEPKDWSDAEDICIDKGGNLAPVRDSEVDSLRAWVKQLTGNPPDRVWVGGYQMHEGSFHWSSSEHFGFTKWGTGEPSDTTGVEDCVEMMYTNHLLEVQPFNDAPCNVQKSFICARDPIATH